MKTEGISVGRLTCNESDEVAQVASMTDSALHALVGQAAHQHHVLLAQATQQVVQVGGCEDVRTCFGQHYLIIQRLDGVDHLVHVDPQLEQLE